MSSSRPVATSAWSRARKVVFISFAVLACCADDRPAVHEQASVSQAALLATTTLNVAGDTYLRTGNSNSNQGGEATLKLQASGKNRSLLFFDTAAIVQAIGSGTLASATLELTIANTPSGWGTAGRTIVAHRLKRVRCPSSEGREEGPSRCAAAEAEHRPAFHPAMNTSARLSNLPFLSRTCGSTVTCSLPCLSLPSRAAGLTNCGRAAPHPKG